MIFKNYYIPYNYVQKYFFKSVVIAYRSFICTTWWMYFRILRADLLFILFVEICHKMYSATNSNVTNSHWFGRLLITGDFTFVTFQQHDTDSIIMY